MWSFTWQTVSLCSPTSGSVACGVATRGSFIPVSYTHLDVYKRQHQDIAADALEVGGRQSDEDGERRTGQCGERLYRCLLYTSGMPFKLRAAPPAANPAVRVQSYALNAVSDRGLTRTISVNPVSYTHLDVYKRQLYYLPESRLKSLTLQILINDG